MTSRSDADHVFLLFAENQWTEEARLGIWGLMKSVEVYSWMLQQLCKEAVLKNCLFLFERKPTLLFSESP